jgi:hypothetical protein
MPRLPLLLLVFAAAWAALPVQAQLLLSPTRVVFEGTMRATQVDVVNTTTQRAVYRLSLVNRRMTERGENVAADPPLPEERFLGEMVRFSPRQLVLEPGASQVVRLSLRKPEGLQPGEYRSHLHIERVADGSDANSVETVAGAGSPQGMQIRLTALVGAMIPVIVREGPPAVTLSVRDLQLAPASGSDPAALSLALAREGNRSVYGDVIVTHVPATGGAGVEVARLSGIAVYVPNPLLRLRLALQPPPGLALDRGRLRVAFVLKPEEGARALAEAELELR